MSQKYRRIGGIEVYEPVRPKDPSWLGWFLVMMSVILLLAKCSH